MLSITKTLKTLKPNNLQTRQISSLKVEWRKDTKLDQAIEHDKKYKLCSKVIKEVLNEPGQSIPLHFLEKRRERLRLNVKIKTFIEKNPTLFHLYVDKLKQKSQPLPFVKPSERLKRFLEDEARVYRDNEGLIVAKLCKLLMIAKDRVIHADKLVHVKREFGFPNDFMVSIVDKYPNYFKLHGSPGGQEKSFLELVEWNPEFAKSVIELRAEEESKATGIQVRPSFNYKLPPGFFLRKEMREWVRDWLEQVYISPYADASYYDQGSPEMENRMVGVLHELLSLSLYKRVPIPILGKFCDEFRFSNSFSSVFTRHSGIFYMSLKGGIRTAVLREAYKDDVLVDRDPLLEIKDKFVELLEEGWREYEEKIKLKGELLKKDKEIMSEIKSRDLDDQGLDEEQ